MSGVLTHPESLSPDAQKRLRDNFAENYGGAYNAAKPAILEEGMKWERLGIPPEEAQFIETRQFQAEEICRWFRVPPHKIQHLLRSTFSNISHQAIEYVVDTLTPWLVRWEQEIQRKLLVGDGDYFAEHLTLGLLRGDEASRVAFYGGMFQMGAMSQNDIREAENMNWIGPDGDTYYVPLNMVRSEDAAAGLPQNTEPEANEEELPTMPGPLEEPEDGNPPDDEEDEEDEEDEATERAAVVQHLRPLVEQLLGIVLRKEEKAAVRSAEKFTGNAAAFGEWLDTFYAEHLTYFLETLKPFCEAAMGILERPIWSPAVAANENITANKAELARLFAEGKIGSDFPTYVTHRIQVLADMIMEEALDGAPASVA
jgi:hypothetical protein